MDEYIKVEEIQFPPKEGEEYRLRVVKNKITLEKKVEVTVPVWDWRDVTNECTVVSVISQATGGIYVKLQHKGRHIASAALDARPHYETKQGYKIKPADNSHISCRVYHWESSGSNICCHYPSCDKFSNRPLPLNCDNCGASCLECMRWRTP